jgi:hypothetical protein
MRGREAIVPQRRRRIPEQFSWIDHRLVRDGYIQGRSTTALGLYLFLVTVADADGLSWYSETALCNHLSYTVGQLQAARMELEQTGLIAYRKPLYQVLDLAPTIATSRQRRDTGIERSEVMSVGEVLQSILTGGAR